MNKNFAEQIDRDGEYTLAPDEQILDFGLEPLPDHDGYFRDPETEYVFVLNGQTLSCVAGSAQAFADYLRH